ncbi:MAG: hypothetical protein JSV96_05235, partial [Candidatus Aminicenantes bacterium]
MTIKKIMAIAILLLTFTILSGQEEEDKILLLKIGDKKLKDKTMDLAEGKIYSTRVGSHIPIQKMIK